jgi:hypothetical protein
MMMTGRINLTQQNFCVLLISDSLLKQANLLPSLKLPIMNHEQSTCHESQILQNKRTPLPHRAAAYCDERTPYWRTPILTSLKGQILVKRRQLLVQSKVAEDVTPTEMLQQLSLHLGRKNIPCEKMHRYSELNSYLASEYLP